MFLKELRNGNYYVKLSEEELGYYDDYHEVFGSLLNGLMDDDFVIGEESSFGNFDVVIDVHCLRNGKSYLIPYYNSIIKRLMAGKYLVLHGWESDPEVVEFVMNL